MVVSSRARLRDFASPSSYYRLVAKCAPRISRVDEQKMPIVRVVDMRQEARQEKGIPIFSRLLKEAMTARLEKKEQVMIFLNRRGYSTVPAMPQMRLRRGLPHCSVSLTYHRRAEQASMPYLRARSRSAGRLSGTRAAIRQFVMPDWAQKVEETLRPNCFRTRASSGWIPTRSRRRMICAASRALFASARSISWSARR